jgi:hypothetical protein
MQARSTVNAENASTKGNVDRVESLLIGEVELKSDGKIMGDWLEPTVCIRAYLLSEVRSCRASTISIVRAEA